MRQSRAVGAGLGAAAVLLTVTLAGCGTGSTATPGASATGSSTGSAPPSVSLPAPVPLPSQPLLPADTGGRVLSAGELTAALLPAEALPPGFSQDEDDPAGTAELGDGAGSPNATAPSQVGTSTPPECGRLLDPVAGLVPGVAAQAERSFTGADAFTSVTQDAASYPPGGATAALGAFRAAAAQCATFTGTDADGVRSDYTVGGLPEVAGAGDASSVLRLVGTSEGVQAVFDVVVAVTGSAVVQVIASGLNPLDATALTATAGAAVDRLRTAQG